MTGRYPTRYAAWLAACELPKGCVWLTADPHPALPLGAPPDPAPPTLKPASVSRAGDREAGAGRSVKPASVGPS